MTQRTSKNIADLEAPFADDVTKLLDACKARGVIMTPFYTVRDIWDQAKCWRQSRASAEIEQAIDMLKRSGAPFLAHALESVGPTSGRWATNALPGQSWHQHGLAVDCFWNVNGAAEWDKITGYRVYAQEATRLGLTAGFFWHHADNVHVQKPIETAPNFTWPVLNDLMEKKYA